ncbi:hypothetical protein [Nocardia cyriacigeorgica]|uniref:hypothetical protein n=1 Tax=Nocardia cyriacigeorgica TaxID=135487 RepID=UPI00245577D5|nr:hypothetical protein [Nocardia cyriacigeorgica]
MTRDEIRARAIEVISSARAGYVPRCHAEAAVDALAEAGLLPTGEQFGVGGDAAPCCIHEDEHAARLDQAAHGGPLRHRWTHNWQEVVAAEQCSVQGGE